MRILHLRVAFTVSSGLQAFGEGLANFDAKRQLQLGRPALPQGVIQSVDAAGGDVLRVLKELPPHGRTSYITCLGMSLLAGLSTTLGAAVVLLMPGNRVPPAQMAFILALAAGVMLSASLLEFWLPALVRGGAVGEAMGRIILFTSIGVVVFIIFTALMPEPEMGDEKFSPRPIPTDPESLQVEHDGPPSARRSLTEAAVYGKARDTAAAPQEQREPIADSPGRRWRLAMVLLVTLTAHNFPEGLAVAVSALDNEQMGLVVMIAIAIHNIPEGIAISIPVLSATGSRWKAVWMTLLSGFAEPLGACVALALTSYNGGPSEQSMHDLLCAVGGVMAAVSLKELLPESFRWHQPCASLAGLITGFFVMYMTDKLGA